jgi:imidazolonepropionase-like amidohydrolase
MFESLYKPIPEPQRQLIRDGFEQFQLPLTRALNKRGVKLLAGSDTLLPTLVPGFALHRELKELVAAGLSNYEALRSSTTYPFEYLGEQVEFGAFQIGKAANLVLLEANPLEDISNSSSIAGVVFQGRWISKDNILKRMHMISTGETGR